MTRRGRARRRGLAATAAALAAALLTAAGGHAPSAARADGDPATAACFGALSRDPAKPCTNPQLRDTVIPSPAAAKAVPDADCGVEFRSRELFVCSWTPKSRPHLRTFALIGDSHAAHWRPALEAVAQRRTWRGVSMSRAGCPFTTASVRLPTAARSRGCRRWNTAVRGWLARHREVSVVFVAQHRVTVTPRKGQSASRALTDGYRRAWRAVLRRHVQHVIVLRDTPRDRPDTQACVARATAAGTPAGPACAVPRRYAVQGDPAAATAKAMRNPRVQVADFTNVFCSSRLCLPVIGGALVHRDTSHMTRQFVTSLGPLVVARVDRLAARWRDPEHRVGDVTQTGAAPAPAGLAPAAP